MSLSRRDAIRSQLADHLSELGRSAGELGFVHLRAAVDECLSRLERESFGPASLNAARALAWRYESLAAIPSQSGTHRVIGQEQPSAEQGLRGRSVLVADDEADVRWSYVGILREAGARAIEARDGQQALDLAREELPDLIVADIVMPRLDGPALCAAVRREPLLDGVPVVLLSWQDDFLHRMRELGTDAQGYLRKEAPAREIIERLCNVLEPLTRLEQALRTEREARGDIEELGVSALLRATRRLRPNASIIVQDPWSLFEVELHEGQIVAVRRTGIDGTLSEGAAALPALVGMSSGRFIVAGLAEPRWVRERVSLDDSFAHAARRLGDVLTAMAVHPSYRVELDQAVLGSYARHAPIGIQRLVARLVAGEPIQALLESESGSRSLVDALLVTLARQGAVRNVSVAQLASGQTPTAAPTPEPSEQWYAPEIDPDSGPLSDPLERENIRAQLAVAMHREPANRVPSWSYSIWRLNVGARIGNHEPDSGFQMELKRTPRVLGFGFAVLLTVTVGFLLWHQLALAPERVEPPSAASTATAVPGSDARVAPQVSGPASSVGSGGVDLSAFAGALRAGVDPSLGAAEGQGVLELVGPSQLRVEVDGVEQGGLPVTLVLDQGRHVVRFLEGARSSYRFYYVKSGATRRATR
ncbi:MAG: response regulator [Polyangiales bacterium]